MKAIISAAIITFAVAPAVAETLPEQILAVHNAEREALAIAPLSWSDTLAADAQRWADHLAAAGKFEHAGSDENPESGENLAAGSAGSFTPAQLAQLWAGEKSKFRPGTFPDVSTSGNWADVGHYTQMIWRNTTTVGCGMASGSGSDYLVCRYNPSGNYTGQPPY